ncbi:hypothetical protein ACFW04_005078 [Cataglyphis niger]
MRQVLKACQAARCRIDERISKSVERSPRRSIFNRLYGAGRFLRRPGNGTGPIEHISGSHEIRFYGRRTSSVARRERKREAKRTRGACDEDKGNGYA